MPFSWPCHFVICSVSCRGRGGAVSFRSLSYEQKWILLHPLKVNNMKSDRLSACQGCPAKLGESALNVQRCEHDIFPLNRQQHKAKAARQWPQYPPLAPTHPQVQHACNLPMSHNPPPTRPIHLAGRRLTCPRPQMLQHRSLLPNTATVLPSATTITSSPSNLDRRI